MPVQVRGLTVRPMLTDETVTPEGKVIPPGTKIRKGSVISLVLGDGVGNREFVVPVITGMRFCDARAKLEEYGIVIGAIIPDPNVDDTCNAYIYRQNPERFDDEKRRSPGVQHSFYFPIK